MTKAEPGNFFEDFAVGQTIRHGTPRTVTTGDTALYTALYGSRFAINASDEFARAAGYPSAPVDDLLVFHIVFGKTVADISLNAIANLGYADCRFAHPVFAGDTLNAVSEVIGVKQNSNGKTGVVYVRSTGFNQHGQAVLSYVRWVMVAKGNLDAPAPETVVPDLPDIVSPTALGAAVPGLDAAAWDNDLAGSPARWADYCPGERIDHVDAMTIEEADHMMAARLFQNTARVHFNQFAESKGRFGRRIVYGGHVISLARALSFNGLANGFHLAAINAGRHVAPVFAGDTVFAWSRIEHAVPVAGREDIGALRVVTYAAKDCPCNGFPGRQERGYADGVVLELDYWLMMVI